MTANPVNILVVDDTPAQLAALSAIVSQVGETVVPAASGREALRHLLQQDFAVVLLDVNMPEPDGFETAALIRRRRRTAHLPIIFITTGDLNDTHVARGYQLGAVDYIYAPVIPEVLLAKVRVFVELERRRAELEAAYRQLKEARLHLLQAEKMASLGQLVAGLAHELNNPLAFVLSHLHTVDREAARLEAVSDNSRRRVEKIRARLAEMLQGLHQIRDLVTNLRTFSRLDEGTFKTIDIRESIESVLLFLHHRLRDRIRVEKVYTEPYSVSCYAGQLNQVLMNLLANAVDAIDGEGVITITTGEQDRRFRIAIRDTGHGIPEDLRDRIFEPFFTTKPVGQGMGLGLAICYSIVQTHQGTLTVNSREGEGSEFVVEIPIHNPAAPN
jgi:two-component system NtrC family sensor kinase